MLPVLAGALALGVPAPAAAHGDTLKVVVTGHREGHVTTQVTWENDGDPVEGPVAATVNAVSGDGTRTAGPWKLVRDGGTGGADGTAWSTAEALPAGQWKVTVEAGFPGLGRGERELTVTAPGPVAAPAAPAPAAPAAPASAAPSTPPAAPPPSEPGRAAAQEADGGGSRWIAVAGVGVAALAGAGIGLWVRRSRERRRRLG
ncbi:hypothetical protein DEJ50_01660 [Streptomyces venezuelae]|uniref:Uncharacterized protein n=1 Tax=Streptomyces venezuelae TaxID=54571 RepID=A0A5P2CV14_STRVZ|nr:hypothetical protein DEJ50_01660 [Streptomyces venezuelae]